ncbi:MAG: asparagine synthase B [Gammaproteobacteria bacterium]
MCGIVAIFTNDPAKTAEHAELSVRMLRHRGPDGIGALTIGRSEIAHARLAIVDVVGGAQPMLGEAGRTALVCNGEIYNHAVIRDRLCSRHAFTSNSDSEAVLHLYEELGSHCPRQLDGMFAFFASDGEHFFAARDPLGIKPLYVGRDASGAVWLSSEIKALHEQCTSFEVLPPGCSLTESSEITRWFKPPWLETVGTLRDFEVNEPLKRLETAVVKRLMSDVPLGVFLSGGLDSSLVAALAGRHLPKLKTFAVGVEGAPDLAAASRVARALRTHHYERIYTPREAEGALERVIYHLESYDPALIRSAVPSFFLSQFAAEHVKVVLTGEGADELFAGYEYFKGFSEPGAVHRECARLIMGLHNMNLQRIDRMTMAHGLEGRVPFLDVALVEWAMSLDPKLKLQSELVPEKLPLRAASHGLLPSEIVWRTKQQFSTGAGADHVLQTFAARVVSDSELAHAPETFPIDTPSSKEAFLYRKIFERDFPGESARKAVGRWLSAPIHS